MVTRYINDWRNVALPDGIKERRVNKIDRALSGLEQMRLAPIASTRSPVAGKFGEESQRQFFALVRLWRARYPDSA